MLTKSDLEAIRMMLRAELEAHGFKKIPKDQAARQRDYRDRKKLISLLAEHNENVTGITKCDTAITKHNGTKSEAHNENVTGDNKIVTRQSRKKTSFVFPSWLHANRDVWDAWVEARTKSKHPPTDWAKGLAVAKLERLQDQGYNVRRLLADAAFHNWQSFYPTKD